MKIILEKESSWSEKRFKSIKCGRGCKVFQIFEFLAKKLEASPQKCRFWEFLIKKKRVRGANN